MYLLEAIPVRDKERGASRTWKVRERRETQFAARKRPGPQGRTRRHRAMFPRMLFFCNPVISSRAFQMLQLFLNESLIREAARVQPDDAVGDEFRFCAAV